MPNYNRDTIGEITITPAEYINIKDPNLKKLSLTSDQKSYMNLFASQIPALIEGVAVSDMYTVTFPQGIAGALMKYSDGGFGSPMMADGKIVAHASFHKTSATPTIMLSAFSAMSIATGQYFLSEINTKLDQINQKLDAIITILYDEKETELISEISFVKYAYANFSSIMSHSEQRIATISNLQHAQKVAMKNIEFYLKDMDKQTKTKLKTGDSVSLCVGQMLRTRNCLTLSIQLYVMGCLMETYYSQNMDAAYINYFKDSISNYVSRCDNKIMMDFSTLKGQLEKLKPSISVSKDVVSTQTNRLQIELNSFENGNESPMSVFVKEAFGKMVKETSYCISRNGDVYLAA